MVRIADQPLWLAFLKAAEPLRHGDSEFHSEPESDELPVKWHKLEASSSKNEEKPMPSASHDLNQPTFAAVDKSQQDKNRDILQPILENLIAYGLTIKQLHWNVIGPNFRPIHLHLDEIHEIAEDAIDEVAERITACGHSPIGTLKHVAKDAELKDVPEGFIRDTEVLQLATDRTKRLIEITREHMAKIEEDDTVTADILHAIVDKLEKHHWMLQAQRV